MDFTVGFNWILFCYIIGIKIGSELLPSIVTAILLPCDVVYLFIYLQYPFRFFFLLVPLINNKN